MSHAGVNLGFGSLHAVEHHCDDYAMCTDNVLSLANIAAREQYRAAHGTPPPIRSLELFAREVMPGVRELQG